MNLDYGRRGAVYRHGADPVIVLFKNRYYLFSTDDVAGYRVSDDLITWQTLCFPRALWPLMSDNNHGTYCAPAVATDGRYLYFIRMERRRGVNRVPVMRSTDPAAMQWEQCGELRATKDPALFFDDDGSVWLYHGLSTPTSVFQIDAQSWRELPGTEKRLRTAISRVDDLVGGFERGRRELWGETDASAWLGRFQMLPCQEAAWMTKRNGRYYLQYATPGTVSQWYCDVALEGAAPNGPFMPTDYSPVSFKVGGFMNSAGHSCVFQDRYGNWWRATTLWVGMRDPFERRIGLFPVDFDEAGRMSTDTALGDYPQRLPDAPRMPGESTLAGWWLKSAGATLSASSSLDGHPPSFASDEDARTWWSSRTGVGGEWLQLDLRRKIQATALQINFADQDWQHPTPPAPKGDVTTYRLLVSDDALHWKELPGIAETRQAAGPHDYLELPQSTLFRYVRITSSITPGGGKFAVSELRVFGPGDQSPPAQIAAPQVLRPVANDERNATIHWNPVTNADGYLVRGGVTPEVKSFILQMRGAQQKQITTHVLQRGVTYYWRIDAYNQSGVTPGTITSVRY